ncbi:Fms-interacting protein-domain-containing protein [Helicostylum pulchrum]|uniref:THO complex subunit 5 n=1 Tax=Helicostylum pulchrum TaxID=562976 RepID=A0ABP9Y9F5_9FUNG|nr:Fms-interacting protein-domain-containing protein [Helicostylum pulchrum]
MSNSHTAALDEIDKVAGEVQTVLITQMQKKVEGTLEQRFGKVEQSLIQENFDRLIDLHTVAYASTKDSRQSTLDAKSNMNETRLELQDVMYERKHILEEIVQCRDFRSVYEDVELIPLEEFLAKAGPEYLQNSDNPHQLMINRLKYELVVRTALKEQKEALEIERAKLIKENRKIRKKVDRFDKLLDDFVLSAAPVEEALLVESKTINADTEMIENVTPEMTDNVATEYPTDVMETD